jgi:hypothetical protein
MSTSLKEKIRHLLQSVSKDSIKDAYNKFYLGVKNDHWYDQFLILTLCTLY